MTLKGKRGQICGDRGDLTLVVNNTIKYTDHAPLNCTLETYIILLTIVTPINLINKNVCGRKDIEAILLCEVIKFNVIVRKRE